MASSGVVDRRRNAGPEVSVRPLLDPLVHQEDDRPILNEDYLRCDGRYPEQLRTFILKPGIVSKAPGSAYVEVGNTKLICSVYGPRTSSARTTVKAFQSNGNVSCEVNYAPFSAIKRCSHPPEAKEEDLALLLLQAVCPAIRRELFPNSYVDIYITVLENDGSILSASITAASLALIQAGIEMLDSVVACTAVLAPEQRVFIMDPDRKEEEIKSAEHAKYAKFVIAMMPNLNQITQMHLAGPVEADVLAEAMSICADGTRALYDSVVRPVLERVEL